MTTEFEGNIELAHWVEDLSLVEWQDYFRHQRDLAISLYDRQQWTQVWRKVSRFLMLGNLGSDLVKLDDQELRKKLDGWGVKSNARLNVVLAVMANDLGEQKK